MLDTFKKYCQKTMDEIYEASLLPVPKGKSVNDSVSVCEQLILWAIEWGSVYVSAR